MQTKRHKLKEIKAFSSEINYLAFLLLFPPDQCERKKREQEPIL